MESKADRVPLEPEKFDQPARLAVRVADDVLVRNFEPFEWLRPPPMIKESLLIGESPRNMLVVIRPADRRKTGLPARYGHVA